MNCLKCNRPVSVLADQCEIRPDYSNKSESVEIQFRCGIEGCSGWAYTFVPARDFVQGEDCDE